ncbi:MAG: ABC transporter ATP-binding protein [Parachlamydiales bacterium]|nr:ABC transporter ATP-binding protein [Parachlamydiales bacterium]
MMPKIVIDIQKLSFFYEKGVKILDNINLRIHEKEFLGIVGPNGGGKSTLIKLMGGLISPVKGKIVVLGKSPKTMRTEIGYVPQFSTCEKHFPISVRDMILMGRLGKTSWGGFYRKKDKAMVAKIMEELEISSWKDRPIGMLSGGEFQRVLIARALVCDPKILLLDEPVSSTDPQAEENIFDLLKRLNERVTIIVVSHDIGLISHYVHRVACLNITLVCHKTSQLTDVLLQEIYKTPIRFIQHYQ